jgi:hypothetical protein
MNKTALALILILAISSLLLVESANAQTIPKPSVPEFTVSPVDRSYTVPITTTQTTDPFTGQQVTHTSGGQYVKNETVEIKIKNPPLTFVAFANGTVEKLYYTVRTKGHFSDYWGSSSDNRWSTTWEEGNSFTQVFASTSDYTVVTLVRGSPNDILMGYADVYIPAGGQEDFQVEASFGIQYPIYDGLYQTGTAFASYADSGWSNTQTLTVGVDNSATPNTSQTNPDITPTVPEFSWLAIVPLLLSIFAVAVIIRHQKTAKLNN